MNRTTRFRMADSWMSDTANAPSRAARGRSAISRAAIVATAFIAAVAAACNAGGTSPSAGAPTSAASGSPATAAPVPSASQGASGSSLALCAVTPGPCELAAGTYSTAPFVFPFEFTVGAGWTNDRDWPHGGEIYLPIGAVQWASGVVKGTSGGSTTPIGPTPADFVAFLHKEPGFTVGVPTPVTIGGLGGQSVDLTTNGVAVQGLYFFAEDAANVDAGEKIRYFLLPKGTDMVVMTMDAFKAAQFEEFAAQAQPVIDSIMWAP
jgi:hypothetical protein